MRSPLAREKKRSTFGCQKVRSPVACETGVKGDRALDVKKCDRPSRVKKSSRAIDRHDTKKSVSEALEEDRPSKSEKLSRAIDLWISKRAIALP